MTKFKLPLIGPGENKLITQDMESLLHIINPNQKVSFNSGK